MENDLRQTTFAYTTNIYSFAAKLRPLGHNSLGERLITASLETQYYSVFAGYSFSSDRFIDNLINGYNAACKVLELLSLIKTMQLIKIPPEEDKVLTEGIDKIIRLYGASLSTVRKKQQINQTPPVESKLFEAPDETNVTPTEPVPMPVLDSEEAIEEALENAKQEDNNE